MSLFWSSQRGVVGSAHTGAIPPGFHLTPEGRLVTSAACANLCSRLLIVPALIDFWIQSGPPQLWVAFNMKLPADLHHSLQPPAARHWLILQILLHKMFSYQAFDFQIRETEETHSWNQKNAVFWKDLHVPVKLSAGTQSHYRCNVQV